MVRHITAPDPALRLQLLLGEGCVWDSKGQKLYFVDIDGRKVFTYDPVSGIYGFETMKHKITAIALRKDQHGLFGTYDEGFVTLSEEDIPWPPTDSAVPSDGVTYVDGKSLWPIGTNRYNEGAADPRGRFLAGTMGHKIGDFLGTLYSVEPAASPFVQGSQAILNEVTCANGMAWTNGGTTMYFTDSWIGTIFKFDYDLNTGLLSNRTVFNEADPAAYGWPDGMCLDDQGGVWSARWQAGKVIRFSPDGEIDVVIDFPKAWNMTCCIFGGADLDKLFVVSAATATSGDLPAKKPEGGDLWIIEGLGFHGVERERVAA